MESLRNEKHDIFSMTKMEKNIGDTMSVSEENKKTEERVFSQRDSEQHSLHSSTNRKNEYRRKKGSHTRSLNEMFPETDPLLMANEPTVNIRYKAKSEHDVGKHSAIPLRPLTPDLRRVKSYDAKARSASFMSMNTSQFDVDMIDMEDIVSEVS